MLVVYAQRVYAGISSGLLWCSLNVVLSVGLKHFLVSKQRIKSFSQSRRHWMSNMGDEYVWSSSFVPYLALHVVQWLNWWLMFWVRGRGFSFLAMMQEALSLENMVIAFRWTDGHPCIHLRLFSNADLMNFHIHVMIVIMFLIWYFQHTCWNRSLL